MKYSKYWHRALAIATTASICLALNTATADTITVDGTTYEDVLVLTSDTSYYIYLPDEGKSLTVLKENVDESQVSISEDEALRQEYLERYDASAQRLEAVVADEPDTTADDVFKVRADEGTSAEEYYDAATPNAPALQVLEVLRRGPIEPADATITVVEFWATWCGPCRRSIPELSRLQAKYAPKGVAFLGVTSESPEVAQPYVTKMGDEMNYTVLADYQMRTSNAYASLFNIGTIPHAYIIGADGKIAWHGHPMEKDFVLNLEALTR